MGEPEAGIKPKFTPRVGRRATRMVFFKAALTMRSTGKSAAATLMSTAAPAGPITITVPCAARPLRELKLFATVTKPELERLAENAVHGVQGDGPTQLVPPGCEVGFGFRFGCEFGCRFGSRSAVTSYTGSAGGPLHFSVNVGPAA